MIKKLIALFSLIIVLFSVIFPKNANAEVLHGTYGGKSSFGDMNIDQDRFEKSTESGSAPIGNNGGTAGYDFTENTTDSLIKNLVKILNVLPTTVRCAFSILTYDDDPSYTEDAKYGPVFSIQKTVFGKIRVFDVNFIKREASEDTLTKTIKDKISQFYMITRNMAASFMLLTLIYTGIRMAISTVAEEKAKYKTMIKDWVVGLIILMTLQYAMVIVLEVGNSASNICENIMVSLIEDEDEYHIEDNLLQQATQSTKKGFSLIIPTIFYWLLTYYQFRFILMYFRRVFTMGFLVVIGPFIAVSYSIDKARQW